MFTFVFLHGLLGDKSDWLPIIKKLPSISSVCIDLPFHGDAGNIAVADFDETSQYLSTQIKNKVGEKPYIIVGYSLGGRIALYYALHSTVEKGTLKGVILEGANLGLISFLEKQQRWENDLKWAHRFCADPLHIVLNDWYQQAVFSHLDITQRGNMIKKRQGVSGEKIAKMLLATSLAKQPNFSQKVRSKLLPIFYIVGEKDKKFRDIASNNMLDFYIVENAGHNTHRENPDKFAEILFLIYQKLLKIK